jgi:hypothetical protein
VAHKYAKISGAMATTYLVLNAQEEAALLKSQKGTGGFQSFMRRKQKEYRRGTQELPITTADLDQIPRYAFDYDEGGWEDDLIAIFSRHLGTNLGRR